jgi:hypothetical protein
MSGGKASKTAEIIGIDAFARRIPEKKHRNSEKIRELMLSVEES